MGRMLDLRRFNIKEPAEAIEFLELVEARIPQIKRLMKRQELKANSLRNQVDFERKQVSQRKVAAGSVVANPDPSVSIADRITGKASQQEARIKQLREAQSTPILKAPEPEKEPTIEDVKEYEQNTDASIGKLNVEHLEPKDDVEVKKAPKPKTVAKQVAEKQAEASDGDQVS